MREKEVKGDRMDLFTADELDILFDGVDAWEKETSEKATEIGGSALIAKMFGSDDPAVNEQLAQAAVAAGREGRRRREIGAVLKAKIIKLRDTLLVKKEFEEATGDKNG